MCAFPSCSRRGHVGERMAPGAVAIARGACLAALAALFRQRSPIGVGWEGGVHRPLATRRNHELAGACRARKDDSKPDCPRE